PDREERRRTIVTVLMGSIAALAISRLIADVAPFRMRPMYETGIGYVPPGINIILNFEDWNAFPSDTATWFFALSVAVMALSRRAGRAFARLFAVFFSLPPALFCLPH